MAGGLLNYLDFSLDDEGIMSVERKWNAMTLAANWVGTSVLLVTSDIRRDEAMSSYSLCVRVELAFDTYKNELDSARLSTGDADRAR